MKAEIPEALTEDAPKNAWGKILTATPVIMTVVSTMLAGLSSSEMTRAQYARSLGAQQQAKAGDQWGLFQAKRLRGALQHSTLDLLLATTASRPGGFEPPPRTDPTVMAGLQKGELPAVPPGPELPAVVRSGIGMLEAGRPDSELATLLLEVDPQTLSDAERTAHDRAAALDAATKPVNQAIDGLEKSVGGGDREGLRDLTAARLRYTAVRYDAEARINQTIAQVIELEVRKSNLIADRHQRRSQRFFIGMLGAQAAVIVSTFSLAARQRSILWGFATGVGLAAVGFAVWVYFFV